MSNQTVHELGLLDGKSFTAAVKNRLRNDEAWSILMHPLLIDRTRDCLTHIVESIDEQKARILSAGTEDPVWLRNIDALRRYVIVRLDSMGAAPVPVLSTSKEAARWRSFSAQLAMALETGDTDALDRLKTPYGGLTARAWLAAREEKTGATK